MIVPASLTVLAAIVNRGAIPVIVDIGDTFSIAPKATEKCIARRTAGIVIVHMGGAPGNNELREVILRVQLRKLPRIIGAMHRSKCRIRTALSRLDGIQNPQHLPAIHHKQPHSLPPCIVAKGLIHRGLCQPLEDNRPGRFAPSQESRQWLFLSLVQQIPPTGPLMGVE